jgi:hypothetical protein
VAGCGGQVASPAEYDERLARDTLTAALDAWKAGQVDQLSRQTPPLRFSDDDLMMGAKLESYEVGETVRFGAHQDVPVNLVLRDRQGNTVTKTAIYQISLEPRAVLRNDP